MYINKPEFHQRTRQVLLGVWLITLFFTPYSFAQAPNPAPDQLKNIPIDYYRIELILFRVLNGTTNGRPSETISDYSDPVVLEGLTVLEQETSRTGGIDILRSEVMENSWSRLSRSRNFRPLAYQQWDELRADTVSRHTPGGVEGNATRVHGENILPELAEETSVTEGKPVHYTEDNILEALIKPEPVYKLDGRASFGQGRFLHIKLDFEYRQLDTEARAIIKQLSVTAEGQTKASVDTEVALDTKTAAPIYTVFSLEKTRQIVPQKIELFDNEKFGVLVYLEELSVIEATPADTENTADANR